MHPIDIGRGPRACGPPHPVCAARSVSAWALPRPSAIASAKLAKSTVSHRITAIASVNPRCDVLRCRTGQARTGDRGQDRRNVDQKHDRIFRPGFAGASLRKESLSARSTSSFCRQKRILFMFHHIMHLALTQCIWKNSAIGPRDSAGKKLRAPTKSTIKINRNTNMALVVESVPALPCELLLLRQAPSDGQGRHHGDEAHEEHHEPQGHVEERRVGVEARKGGSVVAARGGIGVEHLG